MNIGPITLRNQIEDRMEIPEAVPSCGAPQKDHESLATRGEPRDARSVDSDRPSVLVAPPMSRSVDLSDRRNRKAYHH
jgi:hypothetical protein